MPIGSRLRLRLRLWRLALAGPVLAALWLWTPAAPSPLPPHTARPADADALALLPPDTQFLLAGSVRATVVAGARDVYWQGRAIYVQRQRVDHGGSGVSRHQTVAVVAQHRPALIFLWQGQGISIAADSYTLAHAPRIEPAWSDRWDRASRGFRDGDPALALGRTGRDGRYGIDALLEAPLKAVEEDLRRERSKRGYLLLAARIVATVIVLSLLLPRQSTSRFTDRPPPADNAGNAT